MCATIRTENQWECIIPTRTCKLLVSVGENKYVNTLNWDFSFGIMHTTEVKQFGRRREVNEAPGLRIKV